MKRAEDYRTPLTGASGEFNKLTMWHLWIYISTLDALFPGFLNGLLGDRRYGKSATSVSQGKLLVNS